MSLSSSEIRLPDGQKYDVKPVLGGIQFQSQEPNEKNHPFPIGWKIVLGTQAETSSDQAGFGGSKNNGTSYIFSAHNSRPWNFPTLKSDNMFLARISNPSSEEFKPAASPIRQIAMMLWVSLYWYFQQREPEVPDISKPKGDWCIGIKKDGILSGRNLILELERMGLITTLSSAISSGTWESDGDGESDCLDDMFVSRRMFWQLPSRLFLFTLQPNCPSSFPGNPLTTRPDSPIQSEQQQTLRCIPSTMDQVSGLNYRQFDLDITEGIRPIRATASSLTIGSFYSNSHLPSYYPPAPPMYIMTDNIVRHPVRPKPHSMGEIFYTRFIPSVGEYLSFRVASLSSKPVPYWGPVGPKQCSNPELLNLTDQDLLKRWLGNKRVKTFWGPYVPEFLSRATSLEHSFPVIGLWDGIPFGYFEIYWVKEDILGRYLGEAGDWDRGLHVLVGEEWSRGRVRFWLSSLVHWCLTADYRTMNVCLEPRVDNSR